MGGGVGQRGENEPECFNTLLDWPKTEAVTLFLTSLEFFGMAAAQLLILEEKSANFFLEVVSLRK